MNMRNVVLCAACASGLTLLAVPKVENVTMVQPEGSGKVTVTYDLVGEPGIVTFDIQTNGVSIGGALLTPVAGDVNCKVEAKTGRSFSWKPSKTWPNRRIEDQSVKAVVTAWATNCPPTYMVIDLGNGIKRFYADKDQIPGGLTNRIYKTDKLLMRKIPASHAEWAMGSTPQTDPNRQEDREQSHYVTLTKDFYMAIYPITVAQYPYVKTATDTWQNDGTYAEDEPQSHLTYNWCRGSMSDWPENTGPQSGSMLDNLAKLSGIPTIDLPTESMWEFACRAGTAGPFGDKTAADGVGWYADNCDGTPQPVGKKPANAFDLYDMHGNVWEVCLDYFNKYTYQVGECVIDPVGTSADKTFNNWHWRVIRGGCCMSAAARISSSTIDASACNARSNSQPFGCRPVCDAVIP